MAIPLYLAMTAEEFAQASHFPQYAGWMACHFSLYGRGISNLPESLPRDALLILNDRVPIADHDPTLICDQLTAWINNNGPAGLLLDLQKADDSKTAKLVKHLTQTLPCKVAVSSVYAQEGHPVFLPPVPPQIPLHEYLSPWEGYEIWLDAALNHCCTTVDANGCHLSETVAPGPMPHTDPTLHCRYRICCEENQVRFFLARTKETLNSLLKDAENSGVTTAVGLYQELGAL